MAHVFTRSSTQHVNDLLGSLRDVVWKMPRESDQDEEKRLTPLCQYVKNARELNKKAFCLIKSFDRRN